MRQVPFDPDKDLNAEQKAWWDKWTARATKARDTLVDKRSRNEAADFDGSIWSDLKAWLLANVFHGKCAYCETMVTPGFFGDGEHYRPKGNVTVADHAGVRRTIVEGEKSHPGYYWLAYDWRNLLPSCQRCNNAKLDQFPVAKAHVHLAASQPEVLDAAEEPLLINPYLEDSGAYLAFGEFGVISAINDNPKGKATIEVFNLTRKELTDERWLEQRKAIRGLGPSAMNVLVGTAPDDGEVELWTGAGAKYSRAVQAYIRVRSRALFDEFLSKI